MGWMNYNLLYDHIELICNLKISDYLNDENL